MISSKAELKSEELQSKAAGHQASREGLSKRVGMTPPRRKHEAIALDLGGVLVRVDYNRALARLSRLAELPIVTIKEIIFNSDLKNRHDTGKISSEQFARGVLRRVPRPIPLRRFLEIWADMFDLYPQTPRLLRALRDVHIKSVIFSNTDPIHLRYVQRRWRVLNDFDGFAVSYELKTLKPDLEFFRRAARRVAVDPSCTIFLDDRAENVMAARACGFLATRVRGPAEAFRVLVRAGVLEPRDAWRAAMPERPPKTLRA